MDKTSMTLHAHHIKPVRSCNEKEKNDLKNGICLCVKCHKKIHFKEHKYINKFTYLLEA